MKKTETVVWDSPSLLWFLASFWWTPSLIQQSAKWWLRAASDLLPFLYKLKGSFSFLILLAGAPGLLSSDGVMLYTHIQGSSQSTKSTHIEALSSIVIPTCGCGRVVQLNPTQIPNHMD